MNIRSGKKKTARFVFITCLLAALVVLMLIISMNTGYTRLTPLEVLKTFFGFGTPKQELILFQFRLPRIVISLLVGAGLATAGAILQGLSRNPLADPGLLGINSGAGLAVVLFISFFPSKEAAPVFLLPVLALIGGGFTAALIYVLAYQKEKGVLPIRLILVGVGVAAGISAAIIVLTLKLSPENYQFVSIWMAGSIWGADWKFVLALLPWIAVLLPYSIYKSKVLNVLNLGQPVAAGLGTSIAREQMLLTASAVGLAASCVAIGGSIGFVGLIGPHLARRLVGSQHERLIPVGALVGALLVIVSDTLARTLLQPSEIPVGIVVSVLGAPYFLYLLARAKS